MDDVKKDVVDKIPAGRLFSLFRKYFHYCRPDFYRNIINMLVISSVVIIGAIIIWMVGSGFDAISNNKFDVVPFYLFGFISLVIVLQTLRYINFYLYEWMQQRIIYSLRRDTYKHLLTLSTPFKDKHATGDLLTRLGQDVTRVSEFLVLTPAYLFYYGLTLISYLGVLFYIDYVLTLLILALAPFLLLHQRLFINKARVTAREFLEYQGHMGAFEEQTLTNMQGVVTFSAESPMLHRFDKLFALFRRAAMRNLLLNNVFIVTFELLIALIAISLVVAGVNRIDQGEFTVGSLINFLLYLGYLSVPLRGLAKVPMDAQIRASATERVDNILNAAPLIQDKSNAIRLETMTGEISFENVEFAYPGHPAVIKDFSLKIKPHEFIAIMGPSGVGKSTLAKLMLRLYDVDKGRILLDGYDIRDIQLQSLRRHITAVWQDPFIVNDTIFENLKLCQPDANEKQIYQALYQAHALEFIERLPDGYQTFLGANGVKLSSGQKQRIAISQALLKQANVLILDEATSALDSDSELAIQKSIDILREHCTVIVIAHRMSTITNADRIVYLNNNGTIDVGTYTELQDSHESFRRAAAHQGQEQSHKAVYL